VTSHCDDSVKHSLKHSVIVRDRQPLRQQRETLSETLPYGTWQTSHCDYSVKHSKTLSYCTCHWRQRETLYQTLSYCTWQSSHCDDSEKQSLKHAVIVRDRQVTATTAWNTLWNTQLLYVTDNSLWLQRKTLSETLSSYTWQTSHCDYSVKHYMKHSLIVRDRQVTATTAWNTLWNNHLLHVTDKSLWTQRETLSETLTYCTWQTCHCDDSVKHSLKHSVIVRDRQPLWRQHETLFEKFSYWTWQTSHCDDSVKHSLKHSAIVHASDDSVKHSLKH